MAIKIDSVTARGRLIPRREPYWHKLATGRYVGFRYMAAGVTGTWIARYWDDAQRKQIYKSLGTLEEYADGRRFDKADEQARDWFTHLGKGGSSKVYNVAGACDAYVEHLRTEKGESAAEDAQGRFDRWVHGTALAKVELSKLKREHFRKFRTMLIEAPVTIANETRERAKDTVNRDMSSVRAALNLAFLDGKVTTDFAWRENLKPIRNASRRRGLYLERTQRKAFIEHAAPDIEIGRAHV